MRNYDAPMPNPVLTEYAGFPDGIQPVPATRTVVHPGAVTLSQVPLTVRPGTRHTIMSHPAEDYGTLKAAGRRL